MVSVAHALLRATSALVPTLGGGHGAMRERFLPVPVHSFCTGSHRPPFSHLPAGPMAIPDLPSVWELGPGSIPASASPRRVCDYGLISTRPAAATGRPEPATEVAKGSRSLPGPTGCWGEPVSRSDSVNLTTSGSETVRNNEECQRIAAYIENNPVKAGVVSQAEEYR